MLVVCPSCSQQFVYKNAVVGSVASCPHCQAAVKIPSASQPIPVSNTLGSKSKTSVPALVLGVISVMLGALALLFCWIPFLGILLIPFAVIGGALGVVGLVIELSSRRRAFGMPITGIILCVISAVFPILIIMSFERDTTSMDESFKRERLERTRSKIGRIMRALDAYKARAGRFPTEAQGLQALVTEPTEEPVPTAWQPSFLYLPKDAWSQEYVYMFQNSGEAPPEPKVISKGADGVLSTDDDIVSE